MTITEVGLAAIKPTRKVMDPTTKEGKVLDGMYETIIKAEVGPSIMYYGVEEEDPLRLWTFLDWQNLEEHQTFAKETSHKLVVPYTKFATHGEFTKHLHLTHTSLSTPNPALSSPLTKFTLVYLSPGITDSQRNDAEEKVKKFVDGKGKASWGWGVGDDWPILGGEEGKEKETGVLLAVFVGEEENAKDEGGFEGLDGVLRAVKLAVKFRILKRE